ncbi:MAG: hypothetical protein AAB176_01380 [Pseudomonadota bacterium]
MPVIKIFCPQRPDAQACDGLAQSLRALCLDPFGAQPHAIEVLLIEGVHNLHGLPVFVEIHYRDRPDRHGEVLAQFLQGVDLAVQAAFGQPPRIRSYAVDQRILGAVR